MKKSDRDNSGFHFPINKLNLTNTRNFCIEDLVREHFEKEDYIDIGHENTPIYDLFFHLCFEKFLLKPNWKKWGRNETIKDYPHLIDHLDYPFETKKQYTNPILQEDVKNIKNI
jgi:hypothetical protein